MSEKRVKQGAVAERKAARTAAGTRAKPVAKPVSTPKRGGNGRAGLAEEIGANGANGHVPRSGGRGRGPRYDESSLAVLEGVEAIRHRPGMYIGGTSSEGLLHLVYEAVDNAIDEFNSGHGSTIRVTLDRDSWVTVRDDGRGIPFGSKEHKGRTLPAVQLLMTTLHSGGKFEAGAYKQAGGLHGVGCTVINALSERLEVTIWRDGQRYEQAYERGRPGPHRITSLARRGAGLTGTELRWLFDRSIFAHEAHYPFETLVNALRRRAFLNRGLTIQLDIWDESAGRMVRHTFHSARGVSDYVASLNPGAKPLPGFKAPVDVTGGREDTLVEVGLLPTKGYQSIVDSYANGVHTRYGGTHVSGLKSAVTRVINDYAVKWGIIKRREKEAFKGEIVGLGLLAVVAVKVTNPQFEGQTKNRLNNPEVEGVVRSVVIEALQEWMEQNPVLGKEWIKDVQAAARAEARAQAIRELERAGGKKGQLIDTSLPDKFTPCNTRDPERAELFIVEGDSAGGSVDDGRNPQYQAVFKLRGKILNVARADAEQMAKNREVTGLINVLGCGTRGSFDITKLKFHKIIILTDADIDGAHIRSLLLTFFAQEFLALIEQGYVYVGQPPLYGVTYRGKTEYLHDDAALQEWLARHKEAHGYHVQRFKGLGEMDAAELRATTLDPERRLLKRVTMDEVQTALALVRMLMEDADAEPRRQFLAREGAKLSVEDLDLV